MKFQFFSKHDGRWVDMPVTTTLEQINKLVDFFYEIRVTFNNGTTLKLN